MPSFLGVPISSRTIPLILMGPSSGGGGGVTVPRPLTITPVLDGGRVPRGGACSLVP